MTAAHWSQYHYKDQDTCDDDNAASAGKIFIPDDQIAFYQQKIYLKRILRTVAVIFGIFQMNDCFVHYRRACIQ